MGVYIKDMEMPKCCAECDAEGHYENSYGDEYGFFCPFGYKAYTSETRELKRLDNCPLVPVPPHGRLIEKSALLDKCYQHYEDFMCGKVDGKTALLNIEKEIKAAPTIIPASGGNEDE